MTALQEARLTRVAVPRVRPKTHRHSRFLQFSLFVVPALVVYLALVIVPMVMAIVTSTTDLNQFRAEVSFVGLENYIRLAQDPAFLRALSNTAIIAVLVTVVPNALGLGIAILLDRSGWIFNALRAAFFVPIVLSSVVVSVIWGMMLSDDGLINSMLKNFGVVDPPGWVSDPNIALYSVASVICWQSLGVAVVLFLAGLQGIPRELLEAAEIDGAGRFTRFRTVTWPLLAPVVTITVVLSLIGGFKVYDQVKVITNGGPGIGTTNTLAFDIVRYSVEAGQVGYGQAMATVMLAIIAFVSIFVLRLLQRREVDL